MCWSCKERNTRRRVRSKHSRLLKLEGTMTAATLLCAGNLPFYVFFLMCVPSMHRNDLEEENKIFVNIEQAKRCWYYLLPFQLSLQIIVIPFCTKMLLAKKKYAQLKKKVSLMCKTHYGIDLSKKILWKLFNFVEITCAASALSWRKKIEAFVDETKNKEFQFSKALNF